MSGAARARVRALGCASPESAALTELWLDGLEAFIADFAALPAAALTRSLDDDGTDALAVGRHVAAAAIGHVVWSLRTAGRRDEAVEEPVPPPADRDAVVAELRRIAELVPPALARLTNDDLSRFGHTLLGETLAAETMLEHAILHFARHRRQLAVRLG
jgi:hypothetical protein